MTMYYYYQVHAIKITLISIVNSPPYIQSLISLVLELLITKLSFLLEVSIQWNHIVYFPCVYHLIYQNNFT